MQSTISAADNLIYIAERFQFLETLYHQAKQICLGLEGLEGLGTRGEWIREPINGIVEYNYTNGQYEQAYREVVIQVPVSFEETMTELGITLKFLAGEQLTEDEMEISESSSDTIYNLDFALVPGAEPKLDDAIEPLIDWLSNTINQCQVRQVNLSQYNQRTYPVAANLLRIAKRIRLLESFYEEALDMCSGIADNFEGYGTKTIYSMIPALGESIVQGPPPGTYPLTFKETMNEIRIYLKFLSGQPLTVEEKEGPLLKLRFSLGTNITSGHSEFDEEVEPILLWLYSSLNKCRRVQQGVAIAQQVHLENLYSPSAQLAQQASQRYYNTAAQQMRR